jgi:hypothetical protein
LLRVSFLKRQTLSLSQSWTFWVNIIFKLNQIEQFNSYSHLLQINFVENDISGKSFISFLIFVSLCRSLQKHYTSENYRQVRFLNSQIGSFFNEFWILDTFLQPIIHQLHSRFKFRTSWWRLPFRLVFRKQYPQVLFIICILKKIWTFNFIYINQVYWRKCDFFNLNNLFFVDLSKNK